MTGVSKRGIIVRLFKSLFNDRATSDENEKGVKIRAPLCGEVMPLSAVEDGVFSAGILGDGCAIYPGEEVVRAPFDGTVSMIADTLHAIGLTDRDGTEVLIHIGLDTVEMGGDGFKSRVRAGETVKCGRPLLEFDREKIERAGYMQAVIIVVTALEDHREVRTYHSGWIGAGEPLLEVALKDEQKKR